MALRSPTMFATAFLTLAVAYSVFFNTAIRVNADVAEQRFKALMEMDAPKRAASHGERVLKLRTSEQEDGTKSDIAGLKVQLAEAQLARKNYDRASQLLSDSLSSSWASSLTARQRIDLEDKFARTSILNRNFKPAVAIYASFVELSGDAAIEKSETNPDDLSGYYANRVAAAAEEFAAALNYASAAPLTGGSREEQLATANHMAAIGGYYALTSGAEYAAAGLLATAYETRKKLLGGDHQRTVQLILALGPLLMQMGRVDDVEDLYLEAFHAQENSKGSNNPELSLYIKLLGSIYERQGRNTEAQALYNHMRAIFRDAFGAQRYAVNRLHDMKSIVNRPVSQHYPLDAEYKPADLVSAASYTIPTGKAPSIDEMKVRLAPDPGEDPREANLPARLAHLISLCQSDSGERISLRSGYRSYATQRILHERNGIRGTVTPPGMSEHQTGLAADINVNGRFMRQNDRAYQCFEENGFRYGFILSYPPNNNYLPGKDSHEPWHWRYVGVQTAQLYREAGPYQKPQEFLASLPCYRERARNGIFPTAGEIDICLAEHSSVENVADNETGEENSVSTPEQAHNLKEKIQSVRTQ